MVLISVKGLVNSRAIVRLEGLGKLRKFNDLIGTRTIWWLDNSIICHALPYTIYLESSYISLEEYYKTKLPIDATYERHYLKVDVILRRYTHCTCQLHVFILFRQLGQSRTVPLQRHVFQRTLTQAYSLQAKGTNHSSFLTRLICSSERMKTVQKRTIRQNACALHLSQQRSNLCQ
jgi:hypothetical protein